jgi:hypothetical protein
LLNNCYLPVYNTPEGLKVYSETLEVVTKSFPQYLRELQGTADGAGVEFHKVDEEIMKIGQDIFLSALSLSPRRNSTERCEA